MTQRLCQELINISIVPADYQLPAFFESSENRLQHALITDHLLKRQDWCLTQDLALNYHGTAVTQSANLPCYSIAV